MIGLALEGQETSDTSKPNLSENRIGAPLALNKKHLAACFFSY